MVLRPGQGAAADLPGSGRHEEPPHGADAEDGRNHWPTRSDSLGHRTGEKWSMNTVVEDTGSIPAVTKEMNIKRF